MPERSADERERDRLEREARRAAREASAAPAPARPPKPPRQPTPPVVAEDGELHDDIPIGTRRVRAGSPLATAAGASSPPKHTQTGPPPRRRHRGRWVFAALALGLVVAAGWFAIALSQPYHGDGGVPVRVVIPSGASATEIGDLLAERGVVKSGFFFSLRARLEGKREELRSGSYALRKDMSYAGALEALTTVPAAPPTINVTIPEGRSARETVAIVRSAGLSGDYLHATRRSARLNPRDYGAPRGTHTLEGFLFPATYELRPHARVSKLVHEQLNAFEQNFARVSLRRAKRKHLTPYDVLTIASMVEREAAVPKDRRLIAAVIYNRLHQRMPIGIDATIRYRLHNWSRPLRVSELQIDSAYNTRTHAGLPPTPIGNPGLASIQAAANPAHVSYLFYVVKPCGDGAHAFSSTEAQFQRDVARYNAARARRGGKDPSQC